MVTELDRPELWSFKGEGNANWVFAYAGSLPLLVGKVLRVRKPRPPQDAEQAALEEAVWAPVLGPSTAATNAAGAAAAREQAYVQQLLAPLLGQHHVPHQEPVQTSPSFLRRLLVYSGCLPSGGNGLDFAAAAAAEKSEVAPGVASLMPDVTLLSDSSPTAAPGSGAALSPAVCIELKPKCGFIGGGCATVHPDNRPIKRSRSRFQLHQMLKLAEGKVAACSAYDPQDLFAGDPSRLRAALNALLDQPQNNLLLFLGGQKQQLVGRQLSRKRRQKEQHAAAGEAAVEPEGDQQQQQPPEAEIDQQQQQAGPALEELLAALLPLPAGQRRAALVDLLAGVLEREGVLPCLLQAQQQCRYDIEGIYQLYCHLAGTLTPEVQPAHSAAADGSSRDSDSGGGSADATAEASSAHAAAVRQLLAMPLAEAHAVLRSYVVAATAKDCAIMITLQRLADTPPAASAGDGAVEPGSGGGSGTNPHTDGQELRESQQQQQQQQQGQPLQAVSPPVCRTYCAAAGAWFAYRLAVVDLDLKPLAKIPKHHQLDAAILAAARRHLADNSGGSGSLGAAEAAGAGVTDRM